MLTADGYHVLAAKTSSDGLHLARDHERAVQLLIAPLENGGEGLARRLRSRSPTLRVLWIGLHDTSAPATIIPREHQASLAKPFALSEVLRSVRSLLDA